VPALLSSKQKRTASGRTADSLPISSTTRVTRTPPAFSVAMATISSAMPSSCMSRSLHPEFLGNQRQDQVDGRLHGSLNTFTEVDRLIVGFQGCRLTADQPQARQPAAQAPRETKHLLGNHAVAVGRRAVTCLVEIGLQHMEGARLAAAADGVDEDGQIVAV